MRIVVIPALLAAAMLGAPVAAVLSAPLAAAAPNACTPAR